MEIKKEDLDCGCNYLVNEYYKSNPSINEISIDLTQRFNLKYKTIKELRENNDFINELKTSDKVELKITRKEFQKSETINCYYGQGIFFTNKYGDELSFKDESKIEISSVNKKNNNNFKKPTFIEYIDSVKDIDILKNFKHIINDEKYQQYILFMGNNIQIYKDFYEEENLIEIDEDIKSLKINEVILTTEI